METKLCDADVQAVLIIFKACFLEVAPNEKQGKQRFRISLHSTSTSSPIGIYGQTALRPLNPGWAAAAVGYGIIGMLRHSLARSAARTPW